MKLANISRFAIAVAARVRWHLAGGAGQAERHDDDRGSRVDRARGRRRPHRRRVDRARLSGSALRRSEAELHPEAAEGRPAGRRRPRARDRLAAAAHPAEPQREDSAGRRRLSRRVAAGAGFSTSRRGRSRGRWATSIRSATRTTGSIRRTAKRSPGRSPAKLSQLRPNDRAYFEQRLADFIDPPGRGGEAMAGDDGAVQRRRRSSPTTGRSRTSPSGSASTSSATSSRGRAFRRRRSTRSI